MSRGLEYRVSEPSRREDMRRGGFGIWVWWVSALRAIERGLRPHLSTVLTFLTKFWCTWWFYDLRAQWIIGIYQTVAGNMFFIEKSEPFWPLQPLLENKKALVCCRGVAESFHHSNINSMCHSECQTLAAHSACLIVYSKQFKRTFYSPHFYAKDLVHHFFHFVSQYMIVFLSPVLE